MLMPYKIIIERWLRPDVYKNQEYSVSKAKKPITDYKKASGLPEGAAELTVYYCEQAIGFSNGVGLDDEGYYDALVRMFEQALKTVMALPETRRESFLGRLQDVRESGQGIGWGVGDAFNEWRRLCPITLPSASRRNRISRCWGVDCERPDLCSRPKRNF